MRPVLQRIAITSLSFLMMIGAFSMATGCNTAEGVGDDVEDLGDKIEDATD
jgi:predicted small secreted protein